MRTIKMLSGKGMEATLKKFEYVAATLVLLVGFVSIFIYPEYYAARMVWGVIHLHYIVIGVLFLTGLGYISQKLGAKFQVLANIISVLFIFTFLFAPIEYL